MTLSYGLSQIHFWKKSTPATQPLWVLIENLGWCCHSWFLPQCCFYCHLIFCYLAVLSYIGCLFCSWHPSWAFMYQFTDVGDIIQTWVIIGNMIWVAQITNLFFFLHECEEHFSINHAYHSFAFYIICIANFRFYFFFLLLFFLDDGTEDELIHFIHSLFCLFIMFYFHLFCIISFHNCNISHQIAFFYVLFFLHFHFCFLLSWTFWVSWLMTLLTAVIAPALFSSFLFLIFSILMIQLFSNDVNIKCINVAWSKMIFHPGWSYIPYESY